MSCLEHSPGDVLRFRSFCKIATAWSCGVDVFFFPVLNQSWFPSLKSSYRLTSIHESELLNDCCFSLFVVWSLPCMVSTWTEDEMDEVPCGCES